MWVNFCIFCKKRPGFKSETGRLSKNYLLVKCLPLMREVAKIYDF